MKPTELWNTYDGWRELGYQVIAGQVAKREEKWTGEKLFYFTQVIPKSNIEEEASLYHYDPKCDW